MRASREPLAAGLRPTLAEIAGQMLPAVSSEQLGLAPFGRGPGVRRVGDLAVVDVLALAPPQAPPLPVGVAVGHVATPVCQEAKRKRQREAMPAVSMRPPADTHPFRPRCRPPPPLPRRSPSAALSATSWPCAGFWGACVYTPLLLSVWSRLCYPHFRYHCQHLRRRRPHRRRLPLTHQNLHPLSF